MSHLHEERPLTTNINATIAVATLVLTLPLYGSKKIVKKQEEPVFLGLQSVFALPIRGQCHYQLPPVTTLDYCHRRRQHLAAATANVQPVTTFG